MGGAVISSTFYRRTKKEAGTTATVKVSMGGLANNIHTVAVKESKVRGIERVGATKMSERKNKKPKLFGFDHSKGRKDSNKTDVSEPTSPSFDWKKAHSAVR